MTLGEDAFNNNPSFASVYFEGNEEQWNQISFGISNTVLNNANKYFYSGSKPDTGGQYWRYVNGVPTLYQGQPIFLTEAFVVYKEGKLYALIGGQTSKTLEELKALYKEAPGSSIEVDGNLAVGFPKDNLEKVTVTHRKVMLSHMLEFSVARGQYIRATHISKSDFGSIVSSVKMYRRIHPKEK